MWHLSNWWNWGFVSGHSVCWQFGVWDPGFESCIQQRKTTRLRSIWISLTCAGALKLTTTNISLCDTNLISEIEGQSFSNDAQQ